MKITFDTARLHSKRAKITAIALALISTMGIAYAVSTTVQTAPTLPVTQPALTFPCTALSYTQTSVSSGSGFLTLSCPPLGSSDYAFLVANGAGTATPTFTLPSFLTALGVQIGSGSTTGRCTTAGTAITSGTAFTLPATGSTMVYCVSYTIPVGTAGPIASFTVSWTYSS
jgi:hypothetical protein